MSIADQVKKVKVKAFSYSGDNKAMMEKVIPGPPPKRSKRSLDNVTWLGEVSAETSLRLESLLGVDLEAQYADFSATKTFEEAPIFMFKGMHANLAGSKKIKGLESDCLRTEKRSAEEGFQRDLEALKKECAESTKKLQDRIAELESEMKENAFFFGLKARLEVMAGYAHGEHREWDYSDAFRTFAKEFADEAPSFQSDAEVQALSKQLVRRIAEVGMAADLGRSKAEEVTTVEEKEVQSQEAPKA